MAKQYLYQIDDKGQLYTCLVYLLSVKAFYNRFISLQLACHVEKVMKIFHFGLKKGEALMGLSGRQLPFEERRKKVVSAKCAHLVIFVGRAAKTAK